MGVFDKPAPRGTNTPYLSRRTPHDAVIEIETMEIKEHTYGKNKGEYYFLAVGKKLRDIPTEGAEPIQAGKGQSYSELPDGGVCSIFIALYEPSVNKAGEVDAGEENKLAYNTTEVCQMVAAVTGKEVEDIRANWSDVPSMLADSDEFAGKLVRVASTNPNDGGYYNPNFSAFEELGTKTAKKSKAA